LSKSFDDLRRQIDADPRRRERVEVHKRGIRDALALARLRESRNVTQRQMARALDVSQANVSRIEHEEDLYLSTLRGYVHALGGHLEVNAVFPEETVELIDAKVARSYRMHH
jgi:DNA-binding XRE family transcriptional regulator